MRTLIDILIAIILVFLILWCGIIAWGAYSQHNHAIVINASVLEEMRDVIHEQSKGNITELTIKSEEEINRLQLAQEKLLDANTSSFIFQFVTLIILTVGIAVLALMYSQYRQEQERANKSEKERIELIGTLAPFAKGQYSSVIIASKYCLVFNLSVQYSHSNGNERNNLLIMMADYQNDIHNHLTNTLQQKEGLEPVLHEFILDMAERVKRMLTTIKESSPDTERASVDRVLTSCMQCYNVIWNEGNDFRHHYDNNFQKITGRI